jgi:hypothetical protein
MNLKSFPSLDRGASSTRAHPHAMGQHKLINRSIVASLLSLVAVATVSQPEKAGAVDLNFATVDTTRNTVGTDTSGLGPGVAPNNTTPGVFQNIIYYKDVATGMDARITATVSGTRYSFINHLPNFTAKGASVSDTGLRYQIDSGIGQGQLTWKIDLFTNDHNYTTAATATDFRFLTYDVDGEPSQGEAVRVFKGDTATNSGFAGYQLGTTSPLALTETANSYLFTGGGVNVAENNPAGSVLLFFQNTNSITLQYEANTTSGSGANPVYSAVDGDVSIIGNNTTNFDSNGHATTAAGFSSYVVAKKIPEPFTIIGSLIGGGVAFGMRKKLKATSK